MPLFGHRRDASKRTEWVPGLAATAAAQGWQGVDGVPFNHDMHNEIHNITCFLFGFDRRQYPGAIGNTTYNDAFRARVGGRIVTVANAFTFIEPGLFQADKLNPWVAICAVELPTLVPAATIQSRRLPRESARYEIKSGDPAFDDMFRTTSAGSLQPILTPEVRRRMMSRDDWAFIFWDYMFACVGKGRYESVDDVNARISETLALLNAVPESVLPHQVDHSTDDVIARIQQLDGVDDAMVFLQRLAPAERQQLAASDTPLAKFADVTSPLEAMTRFNSLGMAERMQLLAMFQRVSDNGS